MQRDADNVVLVTFDDPNHSANTWNLDYVRSMRAVIEQLTKQRERTRGVILASAKRTFFAGADLRLLRDVTPQNAGEARAFLREIKAQLRSLETLGIPVVAAINGAALGGGLELALAAHHRIIVDDPSAVVGFPEVTLGLLPGGGGTIRSVRMLGIAQALLGLLLKGQRLRPAQARELGLIDEVVARPAELIGAAKRWIAAQDPAAPVRQPWDADPHYRIPGGTPSTRAFAANLPAFPANLRKQLKGANMPAPKAIMAVAVEGAQVDFGSALEIETRYFMRLLTGQVAKNMIQAFFFDLGRVNGDRGRARPAGTGPAGTGAKRPAADHPPIRREQVSRAVVLGAGMMGSAIAYVCAKAGIDVVLTDVSLEAATRGKAYSGGLLAKRVARGRSSQADADALLARITPAAAPAAAAGAELLIEAVFEDPGVKAQALTEIERELAPGALLGSNTSTLPITELARHVSRPEDFIGVHFFSPVDRMPLVELIRGERTSEQTVARALDFVKQIGKTPIVVRDSRGFFTSRVIATFIYEGISMLAEGVPPASIEQASSQAGYPTPVLQLSDELNMKLMREIRRAAREAGATLGGGAGTHPAEAVIDRMVDEFGRPGRLERRGFYEYDDRGRRVRLWPGLRDAFPPVADPSVLSLRELEQRLLFIEALEAVKCLDERVIESVTDANIGSIFGIGFPPWTGGVLQYIDGYGDGGSTGPAAFVARARELAAAYGKRFEPPAALVARAQRGARFSDEHGYDKHG